MARASFLPEIYLSIYLSSNLASLARDWTASGQRPVGMDLNSSELTEPTAESVQLSKTLAEMQSLDEHDTAEVCIPWRSGSTATPTPLPPFATQGCVQLADLAFRKTQFDLAFALARAGEPSACRDSLVIVS